MFPFSQNRFEFEIKIKLTWNGKRQAAHGKWQIFIIVSVSVLKC